MDGLCEGDVEFVPEMGIEGGFGEGDLAGMEEAFLGSEGGIGFAF
jgi:hypothetical protein